jgi:glutathione S-transferase
VWLLEELELEYTIKPYFRTNGPRAPPALKQVHPLGKAPVVVVEYPDGKRKVVAESGHIISFLIRNFDHSKKLTPGNDDEFDQVEYFTHMCEGSLQPMLTFLVVLDAGGSKAPWLAKKVITEYNHKIAQGYNYPEALSCLDLLEHQIGVNVNKVTGSSQDVFFVGDKLSGADIILSFPVAELCILGGRLGDALDKAKYPHLVRWSHEISDRPAYKRALEKTKSFVKP